MTTANLATLPGYYYLYALYFDYLINNRYHAHREHEKRIGIALSDVAQVIQLSQPYRKTWALRLFTERQALSRFRPELVSEAWRQLREMVDRIGPPHGWPSGAMLKPLAPDNGRQRLPPPPEIEFPQLQSLTSPFPHSPIDYEFDV